MADEEIIEDTPKSGGKLKIILLVVGVLVLLGAAVGGTVFYMKSTMPPPGVAIEGEEGMSAVEGDEADESSEGKAEAIYHKLRPKFVATFDVNGRQRYMQVEITLMARESDVISAVVVHSPLIRNKLVMLISDQDYMELQTSKGKSELKSAILATVRSVLEAEIGNGGIESVLFTNLVMQ